MESRVQMWGNSLAIRIPKAFAIEAELEESSVVDISLLHGQIVIRPISPPERTLDQLLKGITEENIHSEVDTGRRTGREAW